MKLRSLPPQITRAFLLSTALALAFLTGCFESATVECSSGLICPTGSVCTADGLGCTNTPCGNEIVDPGETCDDGNQVDEDDCRADCQLNVCNDGKVDRQGPDTEDCDAFGVDTATCDRDCTFVVCGDDVENTVAGEACDDGNTVSADGCKNDCRSDETCGNGFEDDHLPNSPPNTFDPHPCLVNTTPAPGSNCAEVCDDGNDEDGDGCSSNCLSEEVCGNGIDDVTEVCDDGDPDNTNGCRNDCQGGAGCGNSLLDPATEECDEPGQNQQDIVSCDFDCTIPVCGDGHANLVADVDGVPGLDEVCDPGAPGAFVADCDADCTRPLCGDGDVNRAFTPMGGIGPEQCDDGNLIAGDGCSALCRIESCGNGVTEAINGELCDDANENDLDACRNNCQLPRCGDGIASAPPNEICDTNGNTPSCDVDCTLPLCGDSLINTTFMPPTAVVTESCDDGNTISGDGCSSLCRIESCGNGVTEAVNGELCDDGNMNDLDNCRNNCQTPRCGDGVASTPPIEICDTTIDSVSCDHDCTLPMCNDGIVNAAAGEQCEDGNLMIGDGCNAMCRLEPFTMTVVPAGSGSGTVTSNAAAPGINCGSDCSELYPPGTMVTLTAAPAANSTFNGWSGGGCTGTAPCTVTMSTVRTITATFELNRLTVAKDGTGTGVVTSVPAGINCGGDCNEVYNTGTVVTLTATPTAATSDFTGWSDPACPGSGTCVVTLAAARTITATFTLKVFVLTAARNGTGSGTVTSAPTGIACPGDCTEGYDSGTMVTLVAEPAANSDFTTWSVGSCGSALSCTVTMDMAKTVTATFTLKSFLLTVTKIGSGAGTVTSAPAGVTCGGDCTQTYDIGTMVTLTAAPTAGSRFVEWSGGCSGTATSCIVTMDVAKTVTAEFRTVFVLTVTESGTGTGTVTSDPSGINCTTPASCMASFDTGTMVTLTQTPGPGARFVAWTGACTGTGACTVTMSAARTVNAEFRATFTLTVTKTGSGAGIGSVTSAPAGISCGTDCIETYDSGTGVVLTATTTSAARFSGWSGEGCSGTGTCSVTMSAARNVTANFVAIHVLDVARTGGGSGTVTSAPAGINCGGDCTEPYDAGTMVVLTAAPASEDAFTGWAGGGCSGTGTCTVTMDSALTVTATFVDNTLTVVRTGSGSGEVRSSMHAGTSAINCGGSGTQNCSEDYVAGTMVTLTATPSSGSRFAAWSANCVVTVPATPHICVVTMSGAQTVTAEFVDVFDVGVTLTGSGTGVVTSTSVPTQATQINCGATCTVPFDRDTVVTLTAAPNAGARFAGWSGEGCSGIGTCVVTMTQARSVTATFTTVFTLTVTRAGAGAAAGTVTSAPVGITCGGATPDCSEVYDVNTDVTLTATVMVGSTFTGWSGVSGCGGTGPCTVAMTATRNVTATFTTP